MIEHKDLFIGGGFTASSSTATITAISATTEQVLGTAPDADTADVDAAVAAARAALRCRDGRRPHPRSARRSSTRSPNSSRASEATSPG